MSEQRDDSGQFSQKQPDKEPYVPRLEPVSEALRRQGFSAETIENYSKLTLKDLHLAELYRIGSLNLNNVPDKRQIINPLQARIDRKGRLWVDVMFKKKKGVKLSELKRIMKIHGKPGRGLYISGRIRAENLPQLTDKSIRLQAARPLFPALYHSVPSMKASRNDLAVLPALPNGNGVILGIVDIEGCDFNHPNFIQNNATRLLYLWDQNETGVNRGPKPDGYAYGVEYDQARINSVLGMDSAYDDLKYTPDDMAHGTHVMDIAAGNSPTNPGVAPGADLIFVHLGKPTNPNDEELKSMGSSKYLLDAVQYIFDKAAGRPVVINISLAGNGGPHDGTSPIEFAFDEMLKTPGRAIVIAAGNSYDENLHIAGTVQPGAPPVEIKWWIEDNKKIAWDLRQELEIWYSANDQLKVELIDPAGKTYGECQLDETKSISLAGNPTPLVLIRHLQPDSEPGEEENLINILLDNDNPAVLIGPWTLRLCLDFPPSSNERKVDFQAWIEYSGKSHSHFDGATEVKTTLNTIANGRRPIVVGSYDPRKVTFEVSEFSSAGPTRNRDSMSSQKPEVCAPGEFILAARATTTGVTLMEGTSAAAPHVAGLIALLFQAARERPSNPKLLKMKEIHDILISTADPNPAGGTQSYDPQYGFGHVNALNALSKILGP